MTRRIFQAVQAITAALFGRPLVGVASPSNEPASTCQRSPALAELANGLAWPALQPTVYAYPIYRLRRSAFPALSKGEKQMLKVVGTLYCSCENRPGSIGAEQPYCQCTIEDPCSSCGCRVEYD